MQWLAKHQAFSVAIVLSVLGVSAPVFAERPTMRAVFRDIPPTLDGVINDAFWEGIDGSDVFVERKPRLRMKPLVRTVVKIGYTREHLCVAVLCQDDKTPIGLNSVRDSFAIFRDDAVSLKIDAALDGRTTLGFATNPTGAMLDYRGINESEFRREFDTLWTVRATTTDDGWSAEFRIPWSSLDINPSSPPEAIGFNVSRDRDF